MNLLRQLVLSFAAIAVVATSGCTQVEKRKVDIFIAPAIFDLGNGQFDFVEQGYLFVPENRDRADSEIIGVHFMRFRTTSKEPATPIFMLAGGPGSSWIPSLTEGTNGIGDPAKGDFEITLQMLSDLRSVSDVVVIDQRGAGLSIPQLDCPNNQQLAPVDAPFSATQMEASFKQYVRDCKQAWAAQGRDVDGYHALQLADDIDDLRRSLGYEKISLYAGSFGSEWGFVTLHRHPAIVERVAFRGLEGINNTYDMPTEVLTSVRTILAQAERDSDLAPYVPDGGFLEAVRRRITELEATPILQAIKDPITGQPVEVLIGGDELRYAWRSGVNRVGTQDWPASLVAILNGDLSAVAKEVARMKGYFNPEPVGNHRAMHMAIDCGLSPGPDRREQLLTDPAIELIGDINLPYFAMCEEWAAPSVPSSWFNVLHTDVPALFVHGTWDLSTPLKNAIEIAPGFSNGHLIIVDGGTHGVIRDLYRERPEAIRPLIRKFFQGQPIDDAPDRISLPPVDFAGPELKKDAPVTPH